MPLPGRKRASLVLLLMLAAGLGVAAVAGAAAAQDMECCPAGMESDSACTWLGAADCCPERPGARPPANATPPALTTCAALTPPRVVLAPAAVSPGAPATSPLRTIVLRL